MRFRIPAYVPEGLLLFAVVFGPLAFGAVEPWSTAILEIDFFLLFAVVVLRGGGNFDQPVYKTLLPAVLLLLGLGLFQWLNPRLLTSPASLLPFTADPRATGHTLLLWTSYAALLWSAPQVLSSRDAGNRFVWTLFAVAAFIAIEGTVQLGQGNIAYYGLRPVRRGLPFGPFVNRDDAGAFLVMSAFMGTGLFFSRWLGLRARETLGATFDFAAAQILTFFILGIVLCGAFLSKSRGAFDAFFLSLYCTSFLGVGFLRDKVRRWALRAVLGASALSFVVFIIRNPFYIGYVFKSPDFSTLLRLSMYRSSFHLMRDFPAWGAGLGSVETVFPAYEESLIRNIPAIVDHVHSDWLELGLQAGIAGGLVLGAGLSAFFGLVLRAWKREASRARRWLTAGALAAAAAFLFLESVEFSFQLPANAATFLAIAAYLSSLTLPDSTKGTARPFAQVHLVGG